MTVKSPLPLIRMFTNLFFCFPWVWQYSSLQKMGANTCKFARGSVIKEYSVAGFPGCVGSSDSTHIVTDRCEYNLKNNHLGAKNSLTTRTFNLT